MKPNQTADSAQKGPGVGSFSANIRSPMAPKGIPANGPSGQNADPGKRNK